MGTPNIGPDATGDELPRYDQMLPLTGGTVTGDLGVDGTSTLGPSAGTHLEVAGGRINGYTGAFGEPVFVNLATGMGVRVYGDSRVEGSVEVIDGPLTVDSTDSPSDLILNTMAAGGPIPLSLDSSVRFRENGFDRWVLSFDESKDLFTLSRYSVDGVHLGTPITVDGATGNVTIETNVNADQVSADPATGIAALILDSADDDARINFRESGNNRWILNFDKTDAGFEINRYNAAGALQDQPLQIDGATGDVTFKSIAETVLYIDSPSGNDTRIRFMEDGQNRWLIGHDESADEFEIQRYSPTTGAFLGQPFSIDAATGKVFVEDNGRVLRTRTNDNSFIQSGQEIGVTPNASGRLTITYPEAFASAATTVFDVRINTSVDVHAWMVTRSTSDFVIQIERPLGTAWTGSTEVNWIAHGVRA